MMNSLISFKQMFQQAQGKELSSIKGEVYSFDRHFFKETPLSICLKFAENEDHWKISCASDGESIWLATQIEESLKDGDEFKTLSCDISDVALWRKARAKKLETLYLVTNELETHMLGIGFGFENQYRIYVVNCENEMRFFPELPGFLLESESPKLINLV